MRTFVLTMLAVAVASTALAQGFIPQAEQDARKRELAAYAQKVFDSKDSHDRAQLVRDMVEKDVIRDAQGKALGDGFAVEALQLLYAQGLQKDDVNARLLGVIGLSSLTAPAAREALVAVLKDPTEAIQLRALQAVEKSGVSRMGKDIVVKLASPSPEVAAAAARCLATLNYDPQNQASGAMVNLMARTYDKLMQTPVDDPSRQDLERLIEIVAQSCSKLVPALTWGTAQSMDDLAREIGKFTSWWNAKYLAGLKDARMDARREALSQIASTADRGAFQAVLDAVGKEVDRIKGGEFPEKAQAIQFVVDGSVVLSRVSGLDTRMLPTATPDDMAKAVKAWQDWAAQAK